MGLDRLGRFIPRHVLAVMGLAALVGCAGHNGPPATITPDPTNPMNPMGYQVGATTYHGNRSFRSCFEHGPVFVSICE
jgi:hypothetical protein